MAEINIEWIPTSEIKENPLNRKIFNEISPEKFQALRTYIKAKGLLKPLIINAQNVLLSGHARLMVCKDLGMKTVQVQRLKFDDKRGEDEFLIKDNLLTRDLSAIEVARAGIHMERTSKKFQRRGMPLRDYVAKTLGLSPFQYVKIKAILDADDKSLIRKVNSGELSVAKAYSMLRTKRQRTRIGSLIQTEKPRLRLINEDPMSSLSNFRPKSCDVIIAEPPDPYNSIWTELAARALKDDGSLFILTQKNFQCIADAKLSSFSLVVPICVLGKTHQDGRFIYNHRMLIWMAKSSSPKIHEKKVSTVWDFRNAEDVMLEVFSRIISLATTEADLIVNLFGDNRSLVTKGETFGRNVFAIQPNKDAFVREKLDI